MSKFTFEMLVDVTEQTTVEADSLEDAKLIVYEGNCDWEEVKSQGGDFVLVSKEIL
tara:strand:- start:79 stop:246 length:168 start_codon:yes stop_codon:yes gene_type:complete